MKTREICSLSVTTIRTIHTSVLGLHPPLIVLLKGNIKSILNALYNEPNKASSHNVSSLFEYLFLLPSYCLRCLASHNVHHFRYTNRRPGSSSRWLHGWPLFLSQQMILHSLNQEIFAHVIVFDEHFSFHAAHEVFTWQKGQSHLLHELGQAVLSVSRVVIDPRDYCLKYLEKMMSSIYHLCLNLHNGREKIEGGHVAHVPVTWHDLECLSSPALPLDRMPVHLTDYFQHGCGIIDLSDCKEIWGGNMRSDAQFWQQAQNWTSPKNCHSLSLFNYCPHLHYQAIYLTRRIC